MRSVRVFICSIGLLMLLVAESTAATIIDDFSGGVTAVNHPDPADGGTDAFGTWYDVANDSYGTPSASTLNSSDAMLIDDGGFTNGVYALYQGVVPAAGLYNVTVDMLVNDTATSGMANYQIGVVVNGVHRGPNPSDLAVVTGPGTAVGNYTGLTAGVLDATTIQNVATSTFSANAGDNLLIAFCTSVDTQDFDSNSGFWNGASVVVDNIMLNAIPEPASLMLMGLACVGLGFVRTRS